MQRFRVWGALICAPMLLAAAFLPLVLYFLVVAHVPPSGLQKAMEPVAAVPATVGFVAILFFTRWLARKDGYSMAALGWKRPASVDLGLGVAAGAAVHALNAVFAHPLLHRLQPSFDPEARTFALPVMVLLLTVSAAAEDTLYRGYALLQLQRRFSTGVAIVSTTTFYAMLAPGPDLPLKVWAAGLGLVLCAVRLWRGNLWPVLTAHLVVALAPRLWLELGR